MLPAPTGSDADRAILDALLPARSRIAALEQGSRDASPTPVMAASRAGSTVARCLRRSSGWPARRLAAALPLGAKRRLHRIDGNALRNGLMSLVPHELQRKIATLAPTHFEAPSGSHVPIRYDGEWPVLSIRVQELFGLDHASGDRRRCRSRSRSNYCLRPTGRSRPRATCLASGAAPGRMSAPKCAAVTPSMSGRTIRFRLRRPTGQNRA